MKKTTIYLLIFIFALSLRTYHLDSTPPGLTWDEAALGYNAYSILKTGRDEHGQFMPLIFKSFGDYKPGVYVYLTVPSIAIFGLNEFAVRLPSALFGSLSVIGVGLLVSVLSKSFTTGTIASLVLSVLPWHIFFSRGAWEVNVFVSLLVWAIYFFLACLKNKKISPLIPSLFFAATFFTYQAAKLLTPLTIILLVSLNWSETKNLIGRAFTKSKLSLPLYLILISVVLVYFFQTITGPAGNRVSRLSIFKYRPDLSREDSQIFHNQIDLTARAIASRYLYHFSPEILFKENSTLRESLPKNGLLYLFDAVWLLAGLKYLVRQTDTRTRVLVLGLLFITPLGGSMTLSEYSAVRALALVIPLSIIISLGTYFLFTSHRLFFFLFLPVYVYNIVLGLDTYFNHSDGFLAPGFNYGYKQAVETIKNNPSNKVYLTDVYGQPYIYYLFYTGYDPAKYQRSNSFISGGIDVGSVSKVDNVEFHQFSVGDIKSQKDTLFIGTNGNIPDSFDYSMPEIELYDQISYPNGDPVFRYIKSKL